ncbi:nuclear transport factor 2 family protein [Kutzneria sp. 744]|uniref:nuclear transport factor 2 family protein n=1 Tax=Kutzneria sp. (strain 744) TaxID=345341 RepID=UPI0003EEBA42|nr:nuclear transport factor 2 family protein [Kutzneria sp. 744]EWM10304.1 hypothetical protein KUTG_00608 [Kutzneria sp. 744]
MTEPIEALVRSHLFEVFGQRDARLRFAAVERVYAEDVQFADPDGVVVGREALNTKAQGLLDDAPSFVFDQDGPIHVNHDLSVLAWTFGPEGQPPVVKGMDICLVRDNVIAKVYTVITKAP